MSISVAATANIRPRQPVGDLFCSTKTITLDSVYVAGGEPATAVSFGLSRIYRAENPVITTSTGAAAPVVAIRPLIQTNGSMLLKVMVAADGESDLVEAGAIDLSGLVAVVTVYGI